MYLQNSHFLCMISEKKECELIVANLIYNTHTIETNRNHYIGRALVKDTWCVS